MLHVDLSSAVMVSLDSRVRCGDAPDMELVTGTIFLLLLPNYHLNDWVLGWSLFRTRTFTLQLGPIEQRRRMGEPTWLDRRAPHCPARFAMKLNPLDEMIIVYAGKSDFMITHSRRVGVSFGMSAFFFDASGILQYSRTSKPRCGLCCMTDQVCLCSGGTYWGTVPCIPQAFSSWGSWLQRQREIVETTPSAVHDLRIDESHPLAQEIVTFIFRESEKFSELVKFILDEILNMNPIAEARLAFGQYHQHLDGDECFEVYRGVQTTALEFKEPREFLSLMENRHCEDDSELEKGLSPTKRTHNSAVGQDNSLDTSGIEIDHSHKESIMVGAKKLGFSLARSSHEVSKESKSRSNQIRSPPLSRTPGQDSLTGASLNQQSNHFSSPTGPADDLQNISEKDGPRCPACSMMFSRESNLKRHIDVFHSSAIELSCEYCERKFRRLDNLRRHMLTVHRPSSPSKWTCTHCEQRFASKRNLLIHIQDSHRNCLMKILPDEE
uniref:C2H2-type domain-containing protein n=1 Tax=Compsopogon caeruleus TaxID=31354 RepID=A0A7S1TGS4_9RHOD